MRVHVLYTMKWYVTACPNPMIILFSSIAHCPACHSFTSPPRAHTHTRLTVRLTIFYPLSSLQYNLSFTCQSGFGMQPCHRCDQPIGIYVHQLDSTSLLKHIHTHACPPWAMWKWLKHFFLDHNKTRKQLDLWLWPICSLSLSLRVVKLTLNRKCCGFKNSVDFESSFLYDHTEMKFLAGKNFDHRERQKLMSLEFFLLIRRIQRCWMKKPCSIDRKLSAKQWH